MSVFLYSVKRRLRHSNSIIRATVTVFKKNSPNHLFPVFHWKIIYNWHVNISGKDQSNNIYKNDIFEYFIIFVLWDCVFSKLFHSCSWSHFLIYVANFSNDKTNSWFQTFAVFWILYVFFWVFPRRLIVVCRNFGTLYLFHLHRLNVKYEVWLVRRGRGIYTGDLVSCINTTSSPH